MIRHRPGRAWWVASVLMIGGVVAPRVAEAQSVRFLTFTPAVIPAGATAPLLLEAELTATATRVTVDFSPAGSASVTLDARDDGTDGDRVAGDRIYTVQLPVAGILAALRADDVHRVAIGFLNLFNGTTNVFRGNLFVDVSGPDIPDYPITTFSPFVQATPLLVNIHDPAYFVASDTTRITREFYRWFGDDYDVLNLIYDPQRFSNRTHSVIKNRVAGIGLGMTDGSAQFGSAGRLQGISQFPIARLFDGADTGHIHELGHQWINFLNVAPFASGVPHWPKSSMAGGVMGFSIGGTGGEGGTFACRIVEQNNTITLLPRPEAPVYSDLDLYLMGLLPADQVGPQIVFADQAAVASLTCTGQVFAGPVLRVSAADVIARFGPRVPAFGDAPSVFRLATILVTRDGLATPEAMALYSWFAERGEGRVSVPTHSGFTKTIAPPFFVATGGRGRLDMRVETGLPDFALVPTPASVTVTSGATALYSISALPVRQPFDEAIVFRCGALPAHAACTFSPDRIAPGQTGQDVVLSVATRDAASGRTAEIFCLLPLWWRRPRRAAPPVARSWRWARADAVGALVVLMAALACEGGSPRPNPTPTPTPTPTTTTAPGTYTIVVTGTAGALSHATAVTLTVQQP
jgi:hypothetical protein